MDKPTGAWKPEAPEDFTETGAGARAAYDAADEELGERARENPYAAFAELHVAMTVHLAALVRKEKRAGLNPKREITDRIREYRQLTEVLVDHERNRGNATEAERFFAEMETRLATANLGEGLQPYASAVSGGSS